MIYVIADTHFGHQMLIENGYRDIGFENEIIDNWNKTVNPEDTVFHLGDFCVGKYKDYSHTQSIIEWRDQLNGSIFLIKGNHDNQPDVWYFDHGFIGCTRELIIHINGYLVLFSHEPIQHTTAQINIHGHLHGNSHRLEGDLEGYPWNNEIRYIDMSNHDKFEIKPIPLRSLIP